MVCLSSVFRGHVAHPSAPGSGCSQLVSGWSGRAGRRKQLQEPVQVFL